MKRALLGAALALLLSSAHAQTGPGNAYRLERLQNGDIDQRTQIAQDLYGAGIEDPATYELMAKLLSEGLETVTKKDERLDELTGYTLALGGSGNMAYMPLIDRAMATGIRHLVRHGQEAKETLIEAARNGRPYLTAENVRIITEAEAGRCAYIRQVACEAHGGAEECMEEHRYGAIEAGADSLMLLSTINDSGWLGLSSGPMGLFANSSVVANYYDCRVKSGRPGQGVD